MVICLLSVIKESLINLSLFLLISLLHASPNILTLSPVGMVIPVMPLSTLSIDVQYEFRHGHAQNICISVPILVLHLG